MFNAIASLWHTFVFVWAVAATIIVCYDHWNRVEDLIEWLAGLFRGVR